MYFIPAAAGENRSRPLAGSANFESEMGLIPRRSPVDPLQKTGGIAPEPGAGTAAVKVFGAVQSGLEDVRLSGIIFRRNRYCRRQEKARQKEERREKESRPSGKTGIPHFADPRKNFHPVLQ